MKKFLLILTIITASSTIYAKQERQSLRYSPYPQQAPAPRAPRAPRAQAPIQVRVVQQPNPPQAAPQQPPILNIALNGQNLGEIFRNVNNQNRNQN